MPGYWTSRLGGGGRYDLYCVSADDDPVLGNLYLLPLCVAIGAYILLTDMCQESMHFSNPFLPPLASTNFRLIADT